MRIMSRVALVAVALVTFASLSQADTGAYGQGTQGVKAAPAGTTAKSKMMRHETWAPHHGQIVSTQNHRFETVYSMTGIEVYVYNPDHSPVDLPSGVTGTATISLRDGTKKEVPLALATDTAAGGQPRLVAMTDLLGNQQSLAKVKIEIRSLDGPGKIAQFHETYRPRWMHREKSENSPSGAPRASSAQAGQH